MANDDSSRLLLDQFRDGESTAAAQILDRYVARLVGLVRRRMSPVLQRRVDPEDVVQSALRSFFTRAVSDHYVLSRAGDLWGLLAAISLSKLRRQVEIHTAAKRAVSKEQPSRADVDSLAAATDREPLPGEEEALLDELKQFMVQCSPAERDVLGRRLAGESIADIAQAVGRSQRTVRRWLQASCEALENRLLQEGGHE